MTDLERIQSHLKTGGVVQMTNYLHSWVYDKPACADLFKAGSDSHLYVKQGKHWVDCSGCSIRFGHYV
jgi:hypothetical protein